MPAASRRSSTSMPWAACLPMMRRRTSGFEACSDTRKGLMCCSMMRASSSAERFVKVTNVPARKLETEVVVAQRERRPHVVGELAHEAEDAGVAALLHAVEHHAVELEAPVLALVADKVDLPRLAVEVDVSHRNLVFGRKPAPVDQVAHRLAVDRGDEAAGFEALRRRQGFRGQRTQFRRGAGSFLRAREPAARTLPAASRIRCLSRGIPPPAHSFPAMP